MSNLPVVLPRPAVPAAPKHRMWSGSPILQYFGPQPGDPGGVPAHEENAQRPLPAAYDASAGFRPQFPEIFPSDYGASNDPWLVDGARLLQSWCSDLEADSVLPKAPDFPLAGTVSSLRRVIEVIWDMGVHDDTSVTAAASGNNFIASFTNGAGPSIGFRLDWFAQMLTYGPFDLNIQTSGWTAGYTALDVAASGIAGTQPSTDRSLVLRMRGGINGGSIFVPWVVRAGQGMNYAMNTVARAKATVEPSFTPTISVVGLPSGLVAGFGFNVTLLTAYSPNTALMSRLYGLYDTPGQ